jgi:predicted DNA-binding protein
VQKNVSRSFSLPLDLIARLVAVSSRTGQSKSLLVRTALERHLKLMEAGLEPIQAAKKFKMAAD